MLEHFSREPITHAEVGALQLSALASNKLLLLKVFEFGHDGPRSAILQFLPSQLDNS